MALAGLTIPEAAFAVVDVETTGLSPDDRIVEVAVVRLRGGRELGRFHSLVCPGRPIPAVATAVSGIDDAMVAHAPAFGELWPALDTLTRDAVFVAHNAPFDLHYLSHERKHAGLAAETGPVLDTLRLARNVLVLPRYSLGALVASLGLACEPAHRALSDVLATAALLQELIARLASRVRTIEDLLHAQEPVPAPWEEALGAGLAPEFLETLKAAAEARGAVRIDYDGHAGRRPIAVRPSGIEHNGPLYYLRGVMVSSEESPAVLRCDRIRGVTATPGV